MRNWKGSRLIEELSIAITGVASKYLYKITLDATNKSGSYSYYTWDLIGENDYLTHTAYSSLFSFNPKVLKSDEGAKLSPMENCGFPYERRAYFRASLRF